MGLARSLVETFSSKGLAFALTFLAGVLISRDLGPEGKGAIDALVAMIGLFLLAAPPCEEHQLYLIGRGRRDPARLFSAGLLIALVFGALVWLLVEAVAEFAPGLLVYRDRSSGLLRTVRVPLLRFLALMAPFVILHRLHGGLLLGLRDLRGFNATFVVQGVVLLGAVLVTVAQSLGVRGGIVAQGLSFAVPGLLAAFLAFRSPLVREGSFRIAMEDVLALLKGGFRVHAGAIAAFLIVSSDILILNRHLGPEAVGIYALAAALAGQMRRLLIQPVKDVVTSELTHMQADPVGQVGLLGRATRTMVLLWIPVMLLTALLGKLFIVIVYRPLFAESWPLLLVLVPANLFWAMAVILSTFLVMANRLVLLSVVGIGVAVLSVAMNLWLVPRYGVWAAAWTSLLAYAVHAATFIAIACLLGRGRVRDLLVPRREDLRDLASLMPWRRRRPRAEPRNADSRPPSL